MSVSDRFHQAKFDELPVYYAWKDVPDNLLTEAGLKKRGMRRMPHQHPVAVIEIQRHRRRRKYLLYDAKDALERRPLTSRQKAALERVKARNACRSCGKTFVLLSAEGYCPDCQGEINIYRRARVEAVEWAVSLVEQPFLVLDTETTGLGVLDRIVEIAVINQDGDVLLDTLVNPGMLIPSNVITIHGITNEMVRDQPLFSDILPQLAEILTGQPIVIYNVRFDTRFLSRSGLNVKNYDFQCAMLMYAKFFGKWSSYHDNWRRQSLENACIACNIPYTNMHRAVADCEATRQLVQFMARANPEREGTWGDPAFPGGPCR